MQASTADHPDLSWSQVHETVVMLELAAKQIESAMKDGSASVETLGNSFTELAESMRKICQGFENLPENGAGLQAAKDDLSAISQYASNLIAKAVVAFQFYDKLAQRLTHVSTSLGDLSALVSDKSRLFLPDEWVKLQEKIRAHYSTPEEMVMFDAVIHGMRVEEALEKYHPATSTDNIELF